MLSGIDLFRLAGDRMRYLTARQTVIGQNIANADTPGYQARDLASFAPASPLLSHSPAAGAGMAAPLALMATEPGHLAAPGAGATAPARIVSSTYGEKPDGNTVSLEEQLTKQADISNAFALATAAYTKSITLMKIGIGK